MTRFALRAARLFDGHRTHRTPATVVVDGGRVESLGAAPAGVPVTDLGDVTLVPGLVDAHVHLAFEPGGDIVAQMRSDPDAVVLSRMRRHARQAVLAGVTTVRDLGDRGYLALSLRSTMDDGPEILASGPPITTPGGHCWFLGGEASTEAELRAAVRERAARGVDVIKVMATGGGITPGSSPHESQYDFARLSTVVSEARAHGLPVTAHAHGVSGIAAAVRAGVTGIEHCTFLTASGASPDWQTISAIASAGIHVGVTAGRLDSGSPSSPRVLAARAALARMHREGVRLVCSSDAGVIADKPHDCLPQGLAEFATHTELPGDAVLAAVTSLAADSCSVGHRKGRITPGYDADLLAVPGDPSQTLTSLAHPTAVYRAGHRLR